MMAASATAFRDSAPDSAIGLARGAHGAARPGVTGESAARILWRRRGLIVLATLLTTGLIIAYLFVTKPTYSATATLRIATYEGAAESIGDPGPARPQDEQRIATQMEQLGAQSLARAVVRQLKLVGDPEFSRSRLPPVRRLLGLTPKVEGADPDDIAAVKEAAVTQKLMQRVEIGRAGASHYISVTAHSADPRKAVRIVNAFVTLHLKRLRDEKAASTRSTIAALENRVADLRRQAIDSERAASAYGRSRALIGSAGQAANPIAIDILTSQLSTARSGRAEAAARYRQDLGGTGATAAALADAGAGVAASPVLNDLRAQLATIDKRLADLRSQFGPAYPEVVATRAQRDEIASRLTIEQDRVRRGLAADLAVAEAREAQLSGEVGTARNDAMIARDAGVGFGDLQSAAQTTRAQYVMQLGRLQELKGRGERLGIDASVASLPVLPTVPSDPQPFRLLAVGLVGGLLLGCLAAMIVEQVNTRVYTGDQVARLLGVETFAMVPDLTGKAVRLPPQQLIAEQPTSVFAESIRTTYFELTGGSKATGPCIVVASPLPGEGKTRIAVSLAAVAAGMGLQPVLVELDLRRPSLFKVMGRALPAIGVTDYLEGTAALDDIISRDPVLPQLSVIGVTRLPADPGSLLTEALIRPMIEALGKRFDVVIIDAPPVLPVRDTQTLAMLASATLMVLRWGRTRENAVQVTRRLMRGTVTGAVINRVDYRRHAAAAYGDQLEHYHGYASYFGAPAPTRARGLAGVAARVRRLAPAH